MIPGDPVEGGKPGPPVAQRLRRGRLSRGRLSRGRLSRGRLSHGCLRHGWLSDPGRNPPIDNGDAAHTDRRNSGGCRAVAEPRRYSSAGRPPPRGAARAPTGTTNPGADNTLRRKLGGSSGAPQAAS